MVKAYNFTQNITAVGPRKHAHWRNQNAGEFGQVGGGGEEKRDAQRGYSSKPTLWLWVEGSLLLSHIAPQCQSYSQGWISTSQMATETYPTQMSLHHLQARAQHEHTSSLTSCRSLLTCTEHSRSASCNDCNLQKTQVPWPRRTIPNAGS